MTQSFGQLIRNARKEKGYSQRELAKLVSIDFTYLSKLENDRADYPPKEFAIRSLAENLDLNAEELIFLAGRITSQDEEFFKQNPKEMLVLLRRMQSHPEFADKVFREAKKLEEQEGKGWT